MADMRHDDNLWSGDWEYGDLVREIERLREDIEVAEGSIEDLRRMVLCNLPMAKAHIDKHPEIAKNMLDEIQCMVEQFGVHDRAS